jgi:hypothetical protein
MTATPISPTLLELLQLSLVPDDVYAPDPPEQPDPFGWTNEPDVPGGEPALERETRLSVVPIREKPAKPTLRDRVATVEYIADQIEALDDEALTPERRDELSAELIAALAGTRQKVDAVSATLAMFASLEAAAKAERERLEAREVRYARQAQRLSDYVLAVMSASSIEKLEGETSTLAKRLNPPAVVIAPGAELRSEYLFYPEVPEPRPDKKVIAKYLKAGRVIAGCSLAQTSRLVRS